MLDAVLHELRGPLTPALPVFFVFIAVELLAFRLLESDPDHRGYDVRDTRTSLLMGAGAVTVGLVFRAVSLLGYVALYTWFAPWHLPSDSVWTWVALFFAVDLLWYAYHRFSHRVRIAWAAHQAHHSSEYFNFSTALRQKWNQWFESLVWIPLPLLGFSPWVIYTAFSFNLIYQFFTHTERIGRLPRPIELVFNTPSHHRVHHGSDELYLDRNYGGVLIVWDRLFGTFQAEVHQPTYGLTTPVGTHNVVRLQFHEYVAIVRDVRAARTWRARLGYVFGPPGWAPTTGR